MGKSLHEEISMLEYLRFLYPWSFPFLIYINDLTEDLTTDSKLFADDIFLFSVVHDTQTSANDLTKDLETGLIGLFNGK